MTRPKTRAVLFDLFNTLVPGGSRAQRDQVSRQMAQVLNIDPDRFAEVIRASFDDRTRGRLGGVQETVVRLAQQLGADPGRDAVEAAARLRLEMTRRLQADTAAHDTLAELRRRGMLVGLVSDCSAETSAVWPDSPLAALFDAVSFSCVTGHRKPEPEAYLTAVRQLGVRANECVYVGDGGSNELTGAEELGMRAYRYRYGHADVGDSIDDDATWSGTTLTTLNSALDVLVPAAGLPLN